MVILIHTVLKKNTYYAEWLLFFLLTLTVNSFSTAQEKGERVDSSFIKQADADYTLGENLYKANKYDSSIIMFTKALPALKKIRDHDRYVMGLVYLGRNYTAKELYKEAISQLMKAVDYGKKTLPEPHFNLAQAYNSLGIVQRRKGDYDKALEYFEKSLRVRRALFGELHGEVAKVYGNMGIVYWSKADYETALEYLNKSIEVELKTLKENNPQLANSYNNIGLVFWNMGDNAKALEYYFKAIDIHKNNNRENTPDYGDVLNNIGIAYRAMEEYDKALECLNKSLVLRRELFGEIHPAVAANYLNIGTAYTSLSMHRKALEYQKKSLDIRLQVYEKSHPFVVKAYMNTGEAFDALGMYDSAMYCYKQSLVSAFEKAGPYHPEVAETYCGLGKVYDELADNEKAFDCYQKAMEIVVPEYKSASKYSLPDLKNVRSELVLLTALELNAGTFEQSATIQSKQQARIKEYEAALRTYKLLFALVERIENRFVGENSKLVLEGKSSRSYEGAVRIALALFELTGNKAYTEQAFEFSERSKSRVLLSAMIDSRAKQYAGVPDSLLRREYQLKVDLHSFEQLLNEELLKGKKADQEKVTDFRAKYFDVQRKFESHVQRLEKKYPTYHALKYAAAPATISQLQRSLLTRDDVLVEYLLGERTLSIFVISKTGFEVVELPNDTLFETAIHQMREGIAFRSFVQYTRNASDLYDYLLRPIEKYIAGKHLIIVRDGILHLVPFEALLTEHHTLADEHYDKLPYLLRHNSTSYIPSATLLLELFSRKNVEPPKMYLSVAPSFEGTGEGSNGKVVSERAQGFSPLPNAESEVKQIGELFPTASGVHAIVGEEANEQSFKRNDIWNYKYIHFATHVTVNYRQPELSAIVFSGKQDGSEDNFLYAGEVYNLAFNASMIVLSGCESGSGKIVKGEGILGLTRAFLYAGASNLVVSLWQVADKSTPELMLDFYRGFLEGKSKGAALRQAKLNLIKEHETSAPLFWSPFILVGK
ncbi:MAG: tetratricopeptide repeat protein [Bacteroidetes bacterium]|nr:MAG: tetratricopeptide repeat protein [Bacteroidota bacterium]